MCGPSSVQIAFGLKDRHYSDLGKISLCVGFEPRLSLRDEIFFC